MERLSILYKSKYGCMPASVTSLTGSASNRRYCRLASDAGVCIGVIGTDVKENNAFVTIARHFRARRIFPLYIGTCPSNMRNCALHLCFKSNKFNLFCSTIS